MKQIYVNSDVLKEVVDYINDEITFFGFFSHVKIFLKQLLTNPMSANIDDYLKRHGFERKILLDKLLERGIIEKETKINDENGVDKFSISYKIPKRNFERKMKRLFSYFMENDDNIIKEECGGGDCGGATSCASAMQAGGTNPDAGQYVKPLFGKPLRRKIGENKTKTIFVTEEQYKMLQEVTTSDAGDYQYTVPLNFNGGKDEAYNHDNMIANGIPNNNKKKGVRKKI